MSERDGQPLPQEEAAAGASAGGLESLERLFTHLPSDTGMTFVVLQHLSPDFKSLMDELLARRTPMRVRQAEHELRVEPNTVYLLPPTKEMIIQQRRLLLNDLFFRSLAHDAGDRAVGIILSGSGSDGSRGLLEIRDAGGLVFCETPDSAQFSGMPLSAIRTGVVDHVLTPEKEHLQAAVQEHETANEELQATNEVATMFLDRELCIRRFTPRIADVFHLIPQDVGRPLRAFAHDLQHTALLADIERVLRDGVTVETQTWDRQARCYFLRILPYRGRAATGDQAAAGAPPDAPDGVVLTLTDMSALEHARARLAQLSAIVELSGDAIIGKTLDGVITSWNLGATRLFGYTADEAVGRHASYLYPAARKEEIDRIIRQVRDRRPLERLETTRVRQDGTTVDVLVTYSPILDAAGNVTGVSSIARDISQLIRARQEIADREEHIRLLLDSTAEAIYGIDLSGVCIFCNSSCARLLGYESPAALIGRQMHPLIHHTRADGTPYAPEQSPIYQAMRHRRGTHVDDEVLWRADGTSFPGEYWSHPILRAGEVIGAMVTFLDITERRRAEEELQEAVRRREQFLAMLSHELRNPLAAVLSATRVLERGDVTGADCQEAAQVVARQANHMARLLDDLLDVARITRGRIVLRRDLVDLRDSARSAIEALGPFMAERGTALTVAMDDEPVHVMGDAARLQQIQANLLSNASKYSGRGGRVRFELRREGDEAVIRVSDNGRGIPADMLPRIFDLFVQGDQSLARSEGGLGIGLTLLRTLVELHDGGVEAQSDGVGQGSTFTVRLPLASAAQLASGAAEDAPRSGVSTVALVEDQPDARRMLQLLLETYGVRVYTADNGGDGAALIERLRPDLAFVDLGLPVATGFDVARRIRSNPENRRTRLVALSGYGQDSDVQAALEAGFDEHITKPPDPARLEQLVAGTPPHDAPAH